MNCVVCSKAFEPRRYNQKICSSECRKLDHNNKMIKYRAENPALYNGHCESYRARNRERIRARNLDWESRNRTTVNKYKRRLYRENLNFKIATNLRNRFRSTIGGYKYKSILKLIGCSLDELKNFIESKFEPGMNWQNHGLWHIDHIRPCSSFDLTKLEEQSKCFHYSNLQPLWAKDNLIKGDNV